MPTPHGRQLAPNASDVPDYVSAFSGIAALADHVAFQLYDDRDTTLSGLAVEAYAMTLAELRQQVARAERLLVANVREAGASWDDVGRLLGVSRQAAHERFAR